MDRPYLEYGLNCNELFNGAGAFYQYCYLIIDHLYKAALDLVKGQVVALILQHFQPACLEGANQRGVLFQHFKQASHSRQLHAIYIAAKKLPFRCQYL